MDPNTRALMMGAAGGAAAGPATYVEDVFQTWLYTGTGATQTITNGIDLAGKGGMVWTKDRSGAIIHTLIDTARGAGNYLVSSSTQQQFNVADAITSFNSTGYDLGSRSWLNASADAFASWTFRKQAKFFDVVTYVGDGASGKAILHSLGSVPGFIIIKRTDSTGDWFCTHRDLTNFGQHMFLNQTAAASSNLQWVANVTSTQFKIYQTANLNTVGGTYVAYLFAHDAGGFGDSGNDNVVSCGSFTMSSGDVTVNLGYEPQWLLIKSTGNAEWGLYDVMRGLDYTNPVRVTADTSNAEAAIGGNYLRPTPTGFVANSGWFGSSATFIYIAIRRGPMKTPTDATKVFAASLGASTTPAFTSNFPLDLAITSYRSGGGGNHYVVDRVRGQTSLQTPSTAVESASSSTWKLDQQTGFAQSSGGWNTTHVCSMFRRAPGFFDVVAYTGTGVARTVSHNLGVAPELMIVKDRSFANSWAVYTASGGSSKYLFLNSTAGGSNDSSGVLWNLTTPTAATFSLGTNSIVNNSGSTFIAYLFASCPGVSKVGSYTGTGTTLNIDCGFTNGARFVLIKRTDSTGDWYVWDTARGIIAANDPFLLLNSTAAENTSTDYIDPLSSGFQISSTAPAAINANGGSFIYLAIA